MNKINILKTSFERNYIKNGIVTLHANEYRVKKSRLMQNNNKLIRCTANFSKNFLKSHDRFDDKYYNK